MKHKLFSVVLCGFALILLTGAVAAEAETGVLLMDEEIGEAVQQVETLYTEAELPETAVPAAEGVSPQE